MVDVVHCTLDCPAAVTGEGVDIDEQLSGWLELLQLCLVRHGQQYLVLGCRMSLLADASSNGGGAEAYIIDLVDADSDGSM